MAILWQKVKARTASALGILDGATVATHETNYTAALSSSVINSADWSSTEVQDACVEAVMRIAAALIESGHPEADAFNVSATAIASGVAVPTLSSGSVPRIGGIRRVKDGTNSRPLKQASVDQVRDFINSSSAVFNGYTGYFWALDGSILLHTRTTAVVEFGGFTRASITANIGSTDIIPLNDHHESPIVAGAIALLAPKEGMFMELWQSADKEFNGHLATIRTYHIAKSDSAANLR